MRADAKTDGGGHKNLTCMTYGVYDGVGDSVVGWKSEIGLSACIVDGQSWKSGRGLNIRRTVALKKATRQK
jgi:hypothetical protein